MLYFKNSEIAKRYHVSLGTVRNWIEAAKAGKSSVSLYTDKGRDYIANTPENTATIEQFVADNRKYRNTKAAKTIIPSQKFYNLFSSEQIYDIVKNLELSHEIPRDYNYFDAGALGWNKFTHRLSNEDHPNLLNQTIELLSSNLTLLDRILQNYTTVNILDIGVGNALPVRGLLGHFLKSGKLGRYIGVDISPDMLTIARENINDWFDGKVRFEGHNLDIRKDRFTSILYKEYIKKDSNKTANVILFLGGTIANFEDPNVVMRVIRESMGTHDFLIHTQLLDTDKSRDYVNLINVPTAGIELDQKYRMIFELLNIDDEYYDVEMGYDTNNCERYIQARLKLAITVKFAFDGGERTIHLAKGDAILLWRHQHRKALDVVKLFDENGFQLLQTLQTEDFEYMLTVSKVRHD